MLPPFARTTLTNLIFQFFVLAVAAPAIAQSRPPDIVMQVSRIEILETYWIWKSGKVLCNFPAKLDRSGVGSTVFGTQRDLEEKNVVVGFENKYHSGTNPAPCPKYFGNNMWSRIRFDFNENREILRALLRTNLDRIELVLKRIAVSSNEQRNTYFLVRRAANSWKVGRRSRGIASRNTRGAFPSFPQEGTHWIFNANTTNDIRLNVTAAVKPWAFAIRGKNNGFEIIANHHDVFQKNAGGKTFSAKYKATLEAFLLRKK